MHIQNKSNFYLKHCFISRPSIPGAVSQLLVIIMPSFLVDFYWKTILGMHHVVLEVGIKMQVYTVILLIKWFHFSNWNGMKKNSLYYIYLKCNGKQNNEFYYFQSYFINLFLLQHELVYHATVIAFELHRLSVWPN